MAGEFHYSSSLDANPDTTNNNLMASESALTVSSSSSSLFTTPFKSELDSSETDNNDDDFILELTHQMEDYMIYEEDDDNNNNNNNNNTPLECFVSHNSIPKNQDQNRVNSKRGRRREVTESTQQMRYSRGRRVMSSGSGMRAVFLNRPGEQTGYNGTGVFLPPSANHPKNCKISGCSAALVPTRVIEVLQQHFNNLKSLSPLNNLIKTESTHQGKRSGMQQKSRWRSTSIDYVEKKLPQEWTY